MGERFLLPLGLGERQPRRGGHGLLHRRRLHAEPGGTATHCGSVVLYDASSEPTDASHGAFTIESKTS